MTYGSYNDDDYQDFASGYHNYYYTNSNDNDDGNDSHRCELCGDVCGTVEWPLCKDCLGSFAAKLIRDCDEGQGDTVVNTYEKIYVLRQYEEQA